MRLKQLIAFLCVTTVAAFAAQRADFSGSWQLNPEKSKNVGMMSQMKMIQAIEQSETALDVSTHTTFQGKDDDSRTHYALTGKPASNELPMGGPAETGKQLQAGKLVSTWTRERAVAGGPKVVRAEARSLSPDVKTMTVESVRGSNPALVMVFNKK